MRLFRKKILQYHREFFFQKVRCFKVGMFFLGGPWVYTSNPQGVCWKPIGIPDQYRMGITTPRVATRAVTRWTRPVGSSHRDPHVPTGGTGENKINENHQKITKPSIFTTEVREFPPKMCYHDFVSVIFSCSVFAPVFNVCVFLAVGEVFAVKMRDPEHSVWDGVRSFFRFHYF